MIASGAAENHGQSSWTSSVIALVVGVAGPVGTAMAAADVAITSPPKRSPATNPDALLHGFAEEAGGE